MSFATRAAAKASPPAGPLDRYHDDPVAFATDLIRWPDSETLTPYQADGLARLQRRKRLAKRGPHGLGKTTEASLAVLWFATTRDAAGQDWKIPTTASAWLQLNRYLWPEIHKWARLLRWDLMGRGPFAEKRELLDLSLKLAHGEAFAASPADAARIEGAHAEQILYVFDEAKSIPADVFDAAEGAFAGAGPDTRAEAYALAISTPGEPNGRFYEICSAKPGTEDWDRRHVTKDEAIAAGRMSRQWAETRARQWGAASAVYQNRVEGEFAAGDTDSVIPLAWVEAAQLRWRERHGDQVESWREPAELDVIGVDCAGAGADRTVLARRHGDDVAPLERPRKSTTGDGDSTGLEEMATAGRIVAILRANLTAKAIVDAGGLGSGVTGRAREQVRRSRVVAFVAGGGTTRRDRNGEFGFANKRSAAWWNLRELLDPEDGSEIALPPDDELVGDLTAPRWREMSGGKIQVESKVDIRKRLGRSTDAGDAVVQAFWPGTAAASLAVPSGHLPRLPARPTVVSGELSSLARTVR
jgi:hypothetical protein